MILTLNHKLGTSYYNAAILILLTAKSNSLCWAITALQSTLLCYLFMLFTSPTELSPLRSGLLFHTGKVLKTSVKSDCYEASYGHYEARKHEKRCQERSYKEGQRNSCDSKDT